MESDGYGRHIKRLREAKRMSLRELSREAGMAPASLSAIENGQSSPTLATLNKLLKALGTDFVAFFEGNGARPLSPVATGDSMRVVRDRHREYRFMFARSEELKFNMVRETIAPTEGESEWERHDFDLGGHILSGGPLVLEIEGEGSWELNPGDAFYVKAGKRHRGVNRGDDAIELVTVADPPRY